jgi:hypothetical protein
MWDSRPIEPSPETTILPKRSAGYWLNRPEQSEQSLGKARNGISPAEHAANVQKILSRLHARGIRTISAAQYFNGLPRQSDGIHLTAEEHAQFAARLLPAVM